MHAGIVRPQHRTMSKLRTIKTVLLPCSGGYRLKRTLLMLTLIVITLFAIFKSLPFSQNSFDPYVWRLGMQVDYPNDSQRVACSLPKLQPKNPLLDKYFHDVPPLECKPEDNWVCVEDGYAKVCDSFLKAHPGAVVTCSYQFYERVDDNTNRVSANIDSVSTPVKLVTDVFQVKCKMVKDHVKKSWHNVMCGVANKGSRFTDPRPFPVKSMGLNVLILAFDSLSHMTFMRKLPKTYEYISKKLGAVVLNGYNIVGDGTPQALIPMFTGSTERELPETRKRKYNEANYVNVYPFIWNDFQKNGYVTAYIEDSAYIGTFTYRLKGFDAQPTDHYGRPIYLEMEKVYSEHRKYCLAGTPRHKIFLNYIEQFFDLYAKRPKFFFGFHAELSHDDYNLVGLVDDDVVALLTSFNNKGHLNDTLLIMMGDHGHRFADIRETQQGKQEERLPFFSFVLPPQFQSKYPKAWSNLNINVNRLTTPFDIYPTLKDILSYSPDNHVISNDRQTAQRSISLFSRIPASRTCEDADIEPHWCTCLQMEAMSVTDPIGQRVAQAFVDYANDLMSTHKSDCHELKLQSVVRLEKYIPHKDLLKFKKNFDVDGFVGEFTDNTSITTVTYHIKLITSPGDGHFEASISHDVNSDRFIASESSISRVNAYGDTSHCIAQTQHHLLKYCYCRQQLPR